MISGPENLSLEALGLIARLSADRIGDGLWRTHIDEPWAILGKHQVVDAEESARYTPVRDNVRNGERVIGVEWLAVGGDIADVLCNGGIGALKCDTDGRRARRCPRLRGW